MTGDEKRKAFYHTCLQNFMETKVHISINAFRGFTN
jgi:hypothetical protein